MHEFIAGYARNIADAMENTLSVNRSANETTQVNYAEVTRYRDLANIYTNLAGTSRN